MKKNPGTISEKDHFHDCILDGCRFLGQEKSPPARLLADIEELANKHKDDKGVVFAIRNFLCFAVAVGIEIKSNFEPLPPCVR